ncbi:MAG: phage major capsid protein [Oscillospiraceae bacterium]
MYLKDQLQGFVPTEQATEIIKKVARGSSVIRLSNAVPMNSEKKKIPVMVSGPGAYWVGEGKRISTSGATWIYPELVTKKLAVIVPVTKEKLEFSTIDVFSELQDSIAEAFYTAFDSAALFGYESPFSTSLMGAIRDNGAVVETPLANFDLAASDVMAKVEAAGYDVDGFTAKIGVKNSLRKLRDASGAPIFVPGTDQNELYSQPIEFVRNGAWRDDQAEIIAGEWKYSLVGTHGDISYEILKEATLQNTLDEDGKPLSLAEQDMVAIKATMLIAYLCVKPEAFAALAPTSGEVHDTTLSTLTVGSLTLSPEFASATAAYTTTTTNATNTITATATDSAATIAITVNGTTVANGSSATWNSGDNTVEIKVSNGGYSRTYTVAVKKE